ncbi:MAG: hypothetical protein IKO68_05510 [Oscillospiraceae bacterium]|nr:hypothetical protein [Oscillospiraceae bacterium]
MQIRKFITACMLGLLLLLSACQQAPAAPSEVDNSATSTVEIAETTDLPVMPDPTSATVTDTAEATTESATTATEDPVQTTESPQAETEPVSTAPARTEPSQPAPSESAKPADPKPTEPPKPSEPKPSEAPKPTDPPKPTQPAPTQPTPTQPVHTHSYKATVVAPTCTAKGYTEHKCSCGDAYKDSYTDALGHSFSEQTVAATCTSGGYTQKTCSRCGVTEKANETPALGHDYRDTVVAPTSSSEGYTEHKCARCGDSYKDNYTPKLKVTYDIYQAMTAGNNYAQSRGCIVDTSMTAGNSSYYPANEIAGSQLEAHGGQQNLNEKAIGRVRSTIDNLVAADGNEDELPYTRIRCYIEYHESTDSYEIWVFYG